VLRQGPAHRRAWFKPLRKNLGKKKVELSADDIKKVCDTFLAFKETEHSKIFPNEAFGYRKVTIERPLRLRGIKPDRAYSATAVKELRAKHEVDETAPHVIKKIHKCVIPPDDTSHRYGTPLIATPALHNPA